jgi:hypothetical protein
VTTDEAAPQAASGTGTEDTAKVLDVLQLLWDDEYPIGLDDERSWRTSRLDVIGHVMTPNSPEELGQMLGHDYGPGR